ERAGERPMERRLRVGVAVEARAQTGHHLAALAGVESLGWRDAKSRVDDRGGGEAQRARQGPHGDQRDAPAPPCPRCHSALRGGPPSARRPARVIRYLTCRIGSSATSSTMRATITSAKVAAARPKAPYTPARNAADTAIRTISSTIDASASEPAITAS